MKKLFLASIVLWTAKLSAQTTTCFATPDGKDVNGWSYKDYIIPAGYKIDSVIMYATRPGYKAADMDFIFQYSAGTSTMNTTTAQSAFNYQKVNTSLYNIWINVTSLNFISTGVVRATLPTPAGAVWGKICFAISLQNVPSKSADGNNTWTGTYKNSSGSVLVIGNFKDGVGFDYSLTYGAIKNSCGGLKLSGTVKLISSTSASSGDDPMNQTSIELKGDKITFTPGLNDVGMDCAKFFDSNFSKSK